MLNYTSGEALDGTADETENDATIIVVEEGTMSAELDEDTRGEDESDDVETVAGHAFWKCFILIAATGIGRHNVVR